MTDIIRTADSRAPAVASRRDLAANALVLGGAGSAWFGWAQEAPPAGWARPLGIGAASGVLVAAIAGMATGRFRHGGSAMDAPAGRRTYGRVAGVEVATCALGAMALVAGGRSPYTAAWILLVVGVHFIPLGRLFRIRSLQVAGVLLAPVAVAAAVAGAVGAARPSAVAGAGGGACMVAFGAYSLWLCWRRGRSGGQAWEG